MSGSKYNLTLLGAGAMLALPVWACPTCGSAQELTMKAFMIGLSFFVLPFSFAAFIAWRVYNDTKNNKSKRP